jgi:HTH-type transcriptional regulator/antitoxin HigA
MNATATKENQLPCFECENGTLEPVLRDYTTQLKAHGEVTIPNVPMLRCSTCLDTVLADEGQHFIDSHLDKLTQSITPAEVAHFLEQYKLTQKDAAEITGYGEKNISRWLSGKARASTSVSHFLRLLIAQPNAFEALKQRQWVTSKTVSAFEHRQPDEAEKEVLKLVDYKSLTTMGLVKTTRKFDERRSELCQLAKVADLIEFKTWAQQGSGSVAAFKDTKQRYNPINGGLWLQLGQRAAQTISTSPYSREKLEAAVSDIRELTCHPPHTVFTAVQQRLAEAGVALVIMPKLDASAYRGCTRLLHPGKAMIVHSLKYKNVSQFWRVLFHEMAHLVLHTNSAEDRFEEYEDQNNDPREQEADQWADNVLVYADKRTAFLARHKQPTLDDLRHFANELQTAPAIVAEILNQYSEKRLFEYSYLRSKGKFPAITEKEARSIWRSSHSLLNTTVNTNIN